MSHIIVTGSTTGIHPNAPVSQLPQRLEWNDFSQSIENVTLYVLALQQFQNEAQSDIPSYFQICGIHGLPPTPWDNDPNSKPSQGYCNHGINTFPTWHRPYVALYEQRLVSFFNSIIAPYASANAALGKQLSDAAQIWRLPYWDWAIYPAIPNNLASANISILSTHGTTVSVASPFYRYHFHPVDPSFRPFTNPNFAAWQTTLRAPNSSRSPSAVTQPQVVNNQLAQEDFKQQILDLFPTTLPTDDPWGQFSNHSWTSIHPGQGTLTSIESIHDSVHVDIGGPNGGHMGFPSVAAFDPIFWLHHCQVDRLLALWQAVFPTTYVSPGPATGGGTVNATSPLAPFWKTQSTLASSMDCQPTSAYGYTYPEIARPGPVQPDVLSLIIRNTVDQLYGGGSVFNAFATRSDVAKPDVAVEALTQGLSKATITPVVKGNEIHIPKQAAFAMPPGNTLHHAVTPPSSDRGVTDTPEHSGSVLSHLVEKLPEQVQGHLGHLAEKLPHPHLGPGPAKPPTHIGGPGPVQLPYSHTDDYVLTPDTYRDWIANVTIEKYSLGGPGKVCFFCGPSSEIPANPLDWSNSPIYVGAFSIFASDPEHSGCENCKDQAANGLRIGGTVHLTKTLIRNRCPLTGDAPIQYLAQNLHWRVSTLGGVEKPREEIPSLKVVVQSAGYQVTEGIIGERPERGEWTRHSPVTRGRLGGVNHGEEF